MGEMELATIHRGGRRSTAGTRDESDDSLGGPLENPSIEGIPGDPLLEPHPSEPGVPDDGGEAAPLENPGRARG
jgi:hypothetical protein